MLDAKQLNVMVMIGQEGAQFIVLAFNNLGYSFLKPRVSLLLFRSLSGREIERKIIRFLNASFEKSTFIAVPVLDRFCWLIVKPQKQWSSNGITFPSIWVD